MDKLKQQKIKSPLGIILQIPIWLISLLGLYKLFSTAFLGFTSYNVLEKPNFIGFENFTRIRNDDIVRIALSNTRMFVMIATVLLLVCAVIPALFISKLKLPFGLGILAGYSLVSLSAMLPSSWNYIFSGDTYGLLNSFLSEPVMWKGEYANIICIIILFLICIAPVFAITYIGAKLKKPLVSAIAALCSIPLLMAANSARLTSVIGYPSVDYRAEWLPTIIGDYAKTRFEVGFASALTTVGVLMFLGWCAVIIGLTVLVNYILKKAKINIENQKTFGYSALVFAGVLAVAFLLITLVCTVSNSLKPMEEFFVFPPSVIAKNPTFKNFADLFMVYDNTKFSLLKSFSGLPRLFLIYIFAILPCAIGFAAFDSCKRQSLLLLPLVGLTGLAHELQINYSVANLQAGSLLSGISCAVLIFVSYLVVRLILRSGEKRTLCILLGVLCLITSFFAVASTTLNFGTYFVYEQNLHNWRHVNSLLSSHVGVSAAADLLMLLFTVCISVIPIILLTAIYLLQKNSEEYDK